MKTNFEIEENYAVRLNGIHIDLHNNFDFKKFQKDGSFAFIVFEKTNGDWIKEDEFQRLTFKFINLKYDYLEEGDQKASDEAKEQLGELTFFPSDSREMNDSMIPQTRPTEKDDIIFFFEDGKVIRLNCNRIELKAEK